MLRDVETFQKKDFFRVACGEEFRSPSVSALAAFAISEFRAIILDLAELQSFM